MKRIIIVGLLILGMFLISSCAPITETKAERLIKNSQMYKELVAKYGWDNVQETELELISYQEAKEFLTHCGSCRGFNFAQSYRTNFELSGGDVWLKIIYEKDKKEAFFFLVDRNTGKINL